MDALRLGLAACALVFLSGCQITYLFKTAKNHLTLMSRRVPLEEALQDPRLTEEQKKKLRRAGEAHEFALRHIGLKETANYTTFVQLDQPHVSYVVSASPRWKLEHHIWSYPFVGKLPYKGFADKADAEEEQARLEKQDLDTYLRGVSAYSTLGWFNDSVLSSMLNYREHDLVNTIIHETVHTTLFIKGSADFNERLAVFVGNKGMEQFYAEKEGADSPSLAIARAVNEDDHLFSRFIGPQLEALRQWYKELPEEQRTEELRRKRLREIQDRFLVEIAPKLKSPAYKKFQDLQLNNARLLYYRTYMQDLGDFEKLFDLVGGSWKDFLACAKTLEKAEKPEEALRELNQRLSAAPAETQRSCSAVP